jgi:hypothetical protein
MPTVKRFSNCKITVYVGDHNPLHFHIVGVEFDALVEIATLQVIRGDASAAREALEWAAANLSVIRSEWERLNGR